MNDGTPIATAPPSPASILRLWLAGDLESPEGVARCVDRWFGSHPAFDAELRARFGALPGLARSGALEAWRETARGCLALVIVLDQLSRNIYRGTPDAFAADPIGRAVAEDAIRRRLDTQLSSIEAVFVYLPFEHSETLSDQDRSVECFTALARRAPAQLRARFESFLDFALRHRELIVRFGRFPHRNAILGRTSTAEELAFLAAGGDRF